MSRLGRSLLGAAAVLALAAPASAGAQDPSLHPCEESSPNVNAACHYGGKTCLAWFYAEWKDPLLPPTTRMCVTDDRLSVG